MQTSIATKPTVSWPRFPQAAAPLAKAKSTEKETPIERTLDTIWAECQHEQKGEGFKSTIASKVH